jgi:hypothetical protein
LRIYQLLSSAATCAAICAAYASPAIAGVDASAFDVAGIKLGMTPTEVQTKIAQHFGVNKGQVHTYSQPQLLLGGKAAIIAVNYEAKGESLQVLFQTVSANPADPVPAYQINYKLPFSRENAEQLKVAAIQKYGAPTVNSFPLQWCANAANPALCDSGQVTLKVGNTDLSLNDDRYVQKYLQLLDEQRSRKPRL